MTFLQMYSREKVSVKGKSITLLKKVNLRGFDFLHIRKRYPRNLNRFFCTMYYGNSCASIEPVFSWNVEDVSHKVSFINKNLYFLSFQAPNPPE